MTSGTLSPKTPPTVAAGDAPFWVALSPDGQSAYVTNPGSNNVSQYDVSAGGALTPKSPPTVAAGFGPFGLAVTPAPSVPTRLDDCANGGWRDFGFKSPGRCLAFVLLSRICEVLERRGHHPPFCPPAPPRPS